MASKDPENKECTHWEGYVEGLDIHRCLSFANVTVAESRDEFEHETFLPVTMDYQFLNGYDTIPWLRKLSYHKRTMFDKGICNISFYQLFRKQFPYPAAPFVFW